MLEGAGLGLAMTLAVGAVTFYFQRKLPYKRMLIVTGVFIGFVLVVMVGQTVRTMQGTGWVPITPIDITLPYWAGLWFGVYPTVETIGAQIAAAIFVIGSYFLAQEIKVKRPRRRAKGRPEPVTAGSGREPRARGQRPAVGAHRDALRAAGAIRRLRPWRAATLAIIAASSEPSRSSTSSPVWNATIDVLHGRWCGYWRRIARSLRWPISDDVRPVPELLLDLAHLVVRGLELETWLEVFADVM